MYHDGCDVNDPFCHSFRLILKCTGMTNVETGNANLNSNYKYCYKKINFSWKNHELPGSILMG